MDKVAFTGSPATGRKVMAACAEQALWGGMANAGQTCLAVERVYVVEEVYDRFLARLVERASRIRPGGGPDGLREFARPKAITRQRFALPFGMQSFDRPRFVLPAVQQAMKLRHGRAPRRR